MIDGANFPVYSHHPKRYLTSMKKVLDIRIPLRKGFSVVFSHPLFLIFGAVIAVPRFFPVSEAASKRIFASLEAEGATILPSDIALLLIVSSITLIFGSIGIAALITLANHADKKETLSLSRLNKGFFTKVGRIFQLTLLLILIAVAAGSLLSLPSQIALSKGLEGLFRGLSLVALGLALSIALLLFFLRQFAALYLTLSNISIRSSLENASCLLMSHLKETFLLSGVFFCIHFLLILTLSSFHTSTPLGSALLWTIHVAAFSLYQSWLWTTWTLFFRMIALPKDPEPLVQPEASVLQQESTAVSLDKV